MADDKTLSPAYVAYPTFKSAIKALNHNGGIPDRVDRSVFSSMSGSSQAQLLQAMKFFGIIGQNGEPSAQLKLLATSNENGWNDAMKNLVTSHYASQVKVLMTGTPQTLKESFGEIGGIVTPAIRFLLAACKDTGIPVAPVILRNRFGSPTSRRRKNGAEQAGTLPDQAEQDVPPVPQPNSMAVALLAKFPEFDPKWPDEQQKSWFSAYEKLLQLSTRKEVGS